MPRYDTETMEHQLHRHYDHDGINTVSFSAECLIFAILFQFHVNIASPQGVVAVFASVGVAILFRLLWNRRVVYPRIGYFRLDKEAQLRFVGRYWGRGLLGMMWILGLPILLISFQKHGITAIQPPAEDYLIVQMFLLFLAMQSMRVSRTSLFLSMLILTVLIYALWLFLAISPVWGMLATAAVSLVFGLRKLRRFLSENPRLDRETPA
jgi:hypothetical protein